MMLTRFSLNTAQYPKEFGAIILSLARHLVEKLTNIYIRFLYTMVTIMRQLHLCLTTLTGCITAFQLLASPALSKPADIYSAQVFNSESITGSWIDANKQYLNGWEYQFSQQLQPPKSPATHYGPQVSGKQPVSPYSYHPTFTTLNGEIANTNYFSLNETGQYDGPYNGFLNTTSGNILYTVWQNTNSSFFGQSASADLSSIAGYYSVLRPSPGTLVAFYPYLAEKSGEIYHLVKAPLPDDVNYAGFHLQGNHFYLYETANYLATGTDLSDVYNYRTLSVINPTTRNIITSLDIGFYKLVLICGHQVLLQGIEGKVGPGENIQDDRSHFEMTSSLRKTFGSKSRLSPEDFRKIESLGVTPLSVLCDLDSNMADPCTPTPLLTTNEQYFIGLNSKTGAYIMADGTVDPTCIYEVPFGQSTATPPNPGYTNCHAKIDINASYIASFKLSPDGGLAIITENMPSASGNSSTRLWFIIGYSGVFAVDTVQFMESFPQLEELLKSYKNIVIDSINYQNGIYIVLGHNNDIAFKFQLRQKSTL